MIYFVELLHRTAAWCGWHSEFVICMYVYDFPLHRESMKDTLMWWKRRCRLTVWSAVAWPRLEKITTEILESGKRLPTYMEKSFDSITIANCGFNFQTLSRSGETAPFERRLSFDLAVRTVLSSASIFNCRVADKLAPQKFIDLLGKFTVHFTDHSLLLWVLWLLCHIQLNWFALGNRSGRIYWSEMNLVIIWISIGIWA